jgi:hypothetical protein
MVPREEAQETPFPEGLRFVHHALIADVGWGLLESVRAKPNAPRSFSPAVCAVRASVHRRSVASVIVGTTTNDDLAAHERNSLTTPVFVRNLSETWPYASSLPAPSRTGPLSNPAAPAAEVQMTFVPASIAFKFDHVTVQNSPAWPKY